MRGAAAGARCPLPLVARSKSWPTARPVGLLAAPPGVDEVLVGALQGPQQLEPLEAGGLLDRAGAAAEALLEAGLLLRRDVTALIFTTLIRSVPDRRVNHGMRHAGGVSAHRTADLGFARLDLDRADAPAHPRSSTPPARRRRRPSPAWRRSGRRSALAWATRVDDATAAAIQSGGPTRSIDAEARCAFVGELPAAGRQRPGAHRRHVGRRGGRRGGRDARGQRGGLPAGGRRRGGRRAPRAGRRPRHRRRRRRWSSSPAWTAPCRAWSPG